ncbi:Modification methylase PaeR7I [Mammaliicoccus sciuri]|uniref:Eco57I restriction-modification methylase domain-containing protein n=1 Tax=Mammaliicoccus sciuri TaxID=1296 RepID=UPI001EF54A18|nr:TaqI-like C-terminal specificity domain-containing protein [Mammaliicoccus sciuri]CAG7914794.1 Modification methylase PaeR7I [Mammaliicoccus sciuri]
MLNTSRLNNIDDLVKQLSKETDKWMSLAIAIDLADEILKVILPNNDEWQAQLNRDSRNTGVLPLPLPLDTFKNQKQIKWFYEHPESASARSAFKLFYDHDCALESNFFWFNESVTKQKIAVATEYSQNWEDSDLTRKPQYKVGIDFFLSPDTNSLLLVLSNHQKLRVLEFKNHLSNTQKLIIKNKLYHAAAYSGIENGVLLNFEPQKTIHTTLWNALQLKEVNKQFYNYVSAHYIELVNNLKSNDKNQEDAKQFSSRLLGRLLFTWFLRKMNIINETMEYFNTDGLSSTDYYNRRLKVLFFETLNTEISNRKNGDLLTPYLNGGLFEAKENDFANENLNFPDDFFTRLYAHFDEFNFTTDESSADFELMAVDPEMLGQVFESLLASQIEEDTNERNNTGSFYTPREIVGYMVKETLRQYLYSKIDKIHHKGIDELLDLSDSQWLNRKSTSSADIWGVNSKKITSEIKFALDNFKVIDPAAGSGAFPMGMMQQLLKTYERIEKRFDSYKLKLSIIENNIFGVDIQPMAVEISRLRAWLSVIVDQADKNDIQPLPNLEFKFIAANSLISLSEEEDSLFSDPETDITLENLRNKYFGAKKPHTKKMYQDKYYEITIGKPDMFDDKRRLQLKSFDPFKNKLSADFFDPHIMFGITDGFDAVIGNPPYIHFQKMNKSLRGFYKKESKNLGFDTYAARGDIYTLFYEKGVQLLGKGGILAYITSNKWMRAAYGEKLRDFFINHTNPIQLIDLGNNIFESATVDTNILLLKNEENQHELKAISFNMENSKKMDDYIQQHSEYIDYKTGEIWTILNKIEQSIKMKIESVGKPLKEWNIKINRGVLTGLNDAFIITEEIKEELVNEDPKSIEIIKPILRGRDIRRNEIDFQNLYLINTHNGYKSNNGENISPIDINDYPAIKKWLEYGSWNTKNEKETNIDRLANRSDKGSTLYNLRNLAYMNDFNKPKILYSEIVNSPQFYIDSEGKYYPEASSFLLTGENIETLVKYLNSKPVSWFFKSFYAGGGLGEGYRYKKTFIEKLPIPNQPIYEDDDIIIEKKIFEAYQLNNEEINYIKNNFK